MGNTTVVSPSTIQQQYRLIHDIYVLLNDGDRRVLETFGVTISQYALVMLLNTTEGTRLTTLSRRLLLSKSTITRLVDQLEPMGLVRRIDDPEDRRAQRVSLTAAGADYRQMVERAHSISLAERFGVLTEAEQAQFVALLSKLREGLVASLGNEEST